MLPRRPRAISAVTAYYDIRALAYVGEGAQHTRYVDFTRARRTLIFGAFDAPSSAAGQAAARRTPTRLAPPIAYW